MSRQYTLSEIRNGTGWPRETRFVAVDAMPLKSVAIVVQLTEREAEALAQFVKRAGWRDARNLAVNDDDASVMMDAIRRVQCSLADEGYAPR